MSIPWFFLTLSKVKGFFEINIELMEPQNQVRLETLFPAFCVRFFWRFSYVDDVGVTLTNLQHESTAQQWYQSGYNLFLLVEVVFMLASGSVCMVR